MNETNQNLTNRALPVEPRLTLYKKHRKIPTAGRLLSQTMMNHLVQPLGEMNAG